ncbi:hypothetical protein GUJ93_ZPchr0006g41577 [Zizania palustris]|uniref:PUM-HD domain-containing protein n=1 Tax=Zizania palustris TaxID=103762 RepID=A0A8J5VJ23_ZIZPA|nr:hypothetical protein GUJ93_ZPchr0006g41577 [Zizania palustris]
MDQNHATTADELSMFRSGSAPPTVQGARTAISSLFSAAPAHVDSLVGDVGGDMLSDEEMRSHPAYLSYYYSNERLNPRLPPPMVSKEDWRAAQRYQAVSGGIGDRRRRPSEVGDESSLFSVQPGARHGTGEEFRVGDRIGRGETNGLTRQQSSEWLGRGSDGLIGLSDASGLGSHRKSFADALQENISRPASTASQLSRSNSRNAFDSPNPIRPDSSRAQLQSRSESMNGLRSGSTSPSLVRVQSLGSSISHNFASAVGSSLSRSTTPDPQLIRRTPSPCLPPVGVRMGHTDKKVEGSAVVSHNHDGADITAALSSMNLSGGKMTSLEAEVQNHMYQNFGDQADVLFNVPKERRQFPQQKLAQNADEESINALEYTVFPNGSSNFSNSNMSKLAVDSKSKFPIQSPHGNAHNKGSLMSPTGSVSLYQNLNGDSSNIDVSGRNTKIRSSSFSSFMLNNQLNADGEYVNLLSNQGGSGFQGQPMETMYMPYLQANSDSPLGAAANMNPFQGSNFSGSGSLDSPGYQKAYLASLLAQQKLQYGMHGMPYLGKSASLSPNLYGSDPAFGMGMAYLSSPTSTPFISSPQGHVSQGDRLARIPSMAKTTTGGPMGYWNSDSGLIDNGYGSSLLEEFKTNKTRSFELLDIVGHVVEFSSDQYGSRFIQQKLETASAEEKDTIFPEILPHARTLMTDVFGNYVIQKFFEYGTEPQKKQLASLVEGYVLQLSLQMYGCRVIQKGLEVVGVEQQTQMALELDGSVMKCVRDQNGNHVIQKCIECIPQERIQFIISAFYGHVIELSTHPYGCRVIQRVLEHCDDENTQSAMMEEIMPSVVLLTLDQYGNYVIQHVLQHGKPEERSAIIKQLAGQIVKMSQQKFASNVVEKCLSYGTPEERQILINEMLGTTDENEPLQAMMKDQFANYVVQKVLETCDDQNRELILSRIKVHLNALKRYTYGKHIVARVEKLVAAGERRSGVSSSSSS